MSVKQVFDKSWDQVYEDMGPLLSEAEAYRQELLKKMPNFLRIWLRTFLVVYVIFIGIFLLTFSKDGKMVLKPEIFTLPIFFGIVLGALVAVFIWYEKKHNRGVGPFKEYFKEKIIGGLIKTINESFVFEPNRGFTLETVQNLGVFSNNPSPRGMKYNSNDYVRVKVGNTDVQLAEVEYSKKEGWGNHAYTANLFSGFMIAATFNKNFKGVTKVISLQSLTDYQSTGLITAVSTIITGVSPKNQARVKLEDPVFERVFNVYSTDQVEARYILSPSFMRLILNLCNKYGNRILITFKEGKMYMGVNWDKDMFEPLGINDNPLGKQNLYLYYYELSYCMQIIGELNLNTRLWGK